MSWLLDNCQYFFISQLKGATVHSLVTLAKKRAIEKNLKLICY